MIVADNRGGQIMEKNVRIMEKRKDEKTSLRCRAELHPNQLRFS